MEKKLKKVGKEHVKAVKEKLREIKTIAVNDWLRDKRNIGIKPKND